MKVGAALISFVLDSAKTEKDTPAFLYTKKLLQKGTYKRVGMLMLEESQYLDIASKEASSISPRHLPMLVPPKLWDNLKSKEGCYFRLRSSIMRTISNFQTDALRRAKIDGILQGLDYLGDDVSFDSHTNLCLFFHTTFIIFSFLFFYFVCAVLAFLSTYRFFPSCECSLFDIDVRSSRFKVLLLIICFERTVPSLFLVVLTSNIVYVFVVRFLGQVGWRINVPLLNIMKTAYNQKLTVGDLPGKDIPLPSKEECIRVVTKRIYKTVFSFKNHDDKNDLLDGNDPIPDDSDVAGWDTDENIENDKSKIKVNIEQELDPLIPRFDEKYYKDFCKRIAMKNSAIHSTRCDLHLKIWVANKFQDEVFYYPHNLDFRGRAYPVPPNLNHLGMIFYLLVFI